MSGSLSSSSARSDCLSLAGAFGDGSAFGDGTAFADGDGAVGDGGGDVAGGGIGGVVGCFDPCPAAANCSEMWIACAKSLSFSSWIFFSSSMPSAAMRSCIACK